MRTPMPITLSERPWMEFEERRDITPVSDPEGQVIDLVPGPSHRTIRFNAFGRAWTFHPGPTVFYALVWLRYPTLGGERWP